MSEFINNKSLERRSNLLEMGMGLLEGKSAIEYLGQFQDHIDAVTPEDVIYIVDELVGMTRDMALLKKAVSKLLNIFYEPLNRQLWHFPAGSFLHFFVLENQAMDLRMKAIKSLLKKLNARDISLKEFNLIKKDLITQIQGIAEYEKHYLRKENILFPGIEKKIKDHRCLQVMWSIHDDFRKSIRSLIELLEDPSENLEEINREMGALFFAVYPIVFREEKILFPLASGLLTEQEMDQMLDESQEFGYAFMVIDPVKGEQGLYKEAVPGQPPLNTKQVELGTGTLWPEQLSRILNSLPVDMTFVDAYDEVRYFSNPPHRTFHRSKSIIGRKVQNCHPPESLDMVEKILDSFKSGAKDMESFWINMKGRFILIQYFAIRNGQGNYMGTLEVSQDVTGIRSLQGEKRLIDQ